jgi:hypothetical protein
MKTQMTRLIGILFILLTSNSLGYAANQTIPPLPEYLGVYVASGGKLTELSPNPQSHMLLLHIGRDAIISSLSGKSFSDGNLQLIIYLQGASGFAKIPAFRISKLRNQFTLDSSRERVTETERLQNSWRLTNQGTQFRVAPIPQNPTMMIRAVLEGPLPPGLWAIQVGTDIYDFGIGDNPSASADCEDQYVSFGEPEYRPCLKDTASTQDASSSIKPHEQSEVLSTQKADRATSALIKSYKGTAVFPPGMISLDNLFNEFEKEIREANYTIVESDRSKGIIRAVHSLGETSFGWTMSLRENPESGTTAVMTRGTSQGFMPKDIQKLFRYIAKQRRLDQSKISLTLENKSKPLSDW